VRATIEPRGKRGRPRNRWFDGVSQNLWALEEEHWREIIEDRERWKALTVAAKTLESHKAKKKNI